MNDKDEKMLAIEALIKQFAAEQFRANEVSEAGAMLIMKSVSFYFVDVCLRASLYKRINFNEPIGEEVKTGTKEELIRDFKEKGFVEGEG